MNRAQQYLLPITVLIETMKDVPEIVSLCAQMPSLPGISEEASLAEIVVGCGCIHACTITTTGGQRLLQQEAAFSALAQLGELEWSIGSPLPLREPLQDGSLPQQSDTRQYRDEAIPQRVGLCMTPALLKGLPRRQKQVLLLADGQKQRSDIAHLLGLPPQEVEHMLHQLHQKQLVHYPAGEPL